MTLEWSPNVKSLSHKTNALIRDLCEHLSRKKNQAEQLATTLAKALADLHQLDASIPVIPAKDCQAFMDYIDLDFVASQKKTPPQFASPLEAYVDAMIYSDQQKIAVSPFQLLCKSNESFFKDIFSKPKSVSNYLIWQRLRTLEQIRIPHTFTRLAQRDRISYAELLTQRDTPLYYHLYRQQLLGTKVVTKNERSILRNGMPLKFEPSAAPQLSIIIPVYGAFDLLHQTLMSLKRMLAGEKIDYEIICVDDCSPGLNANTYTRYSGLTVIPTARNVGFSEACNTGARHARGEILLFLNSDTIVCPGAFASVVQLFGARTQAAIIGSRLLHLDLSLQEAGGIVWANGEAANFGRGALPRLPEFEFVRECDYVSGAALFIRHSIWRELGGFDDLFAPAYYEDTDLCLRAKKNGHQVLYCPQSNVIHAEGGTNGTNLEQGVKRYQTVNKKKFIKRWKDWLAVHQPPERDFPAHLIGGRPVIVFVDHYIPKHDRDAGSKATYDFLEYLVEHNYFVIFWPDNLYPDPEYYQALSDLGIMVISGAQYLGKFTEFIEPYRHAITHIFLSRPHVAERMMGPFDTALKEKTHYIGHDVHYERLRREFENQYLGPGGQWAIYSDPESVAQYRTQEVLLWKACQQSLYFTQRECDIVKEVSGAKASLIPLYSHKRLKRLMHAGTAVSYAQRQHILYVGGFAHTPNLDAMNWLLSGVQKGDPWLASLLVIGSNIPQSLLDQLMDLGITYQSDISNAQLEQLHYEAKLVLAPLRFGSGLKGKVVEAIASGAPVVSTAIGLEGLCDDGRAKTYDQLDSFIGAINEHLHNERAWGALREEQRQLLHHYLHAAHYSNALETTV